MTNDEKTLLKLIWELPDVWKSFFGLYTQYIGYLSADMIKTLLIVKRLSYCDDDFDYSDMNLKKINSKATEYGIYEFPQKDEKALNDVLPVLWNHIDEYDLSNDNISDESWNKLMEYLDSKIIKK